MGLCERAKGGAKPSRVCVGCARLCKRASVRCCDEKRWMGANDEGVEGLCEKRLRIGACERTSRGCAKSRGLCDEPGCARGSGARVW